MFSSGSQRLAYKKKASIGMKLPVMIGLGAWFLASAAFAEAAPPPTQTPETARLAGLCRVWGVVKYFHPYLGYQPINWDQALVAAIPKVRAAKTSAEYADAVDSMLATLHDLNTHVVRAPAVVMPTPPVGKAGKQPSVRLLPNGTAVITATDYSQFTDYSVMNTLAQMIQSTKPAKAIVFDLRRQGGAASGDNADIAGLVLTEGLNAALPGLLAHDLALPASRHRMHLGYTPTDGGDHGGYYSALVTTQGRFLTSTGESAAAKPMAFIINAGSVDIHDILGGLQAAHLAAVIQDGPSTDESGVDVEPIGLPEGVQVTVRLSETVNPDGSLGFHPNVTVPAAASGTDPAMDTALRSLSTAHAAVPATASAPLYGAALPEKSYDDMLYPSTEYRLLALFRFWNIINTVYPYKDLIGQPWDDVLTEYIPQMEADTDAHAYGVTAAKMIAEIHDSHGFAFIPALMRDGVSMPPVVLREVQGKTIVAALPDPQAALGLHVGDVITAIDGEAVTTRRARLGHLYAASTQQSLTLAVSSVLLNGHKAVPAVLTVGDAAGTHTITLPRTTHYIQMPPRTTPVYGILPSGVGYMDLARLTPADVDKAFQTVTKTPGLIFDMRGYPNGTAWAIAPYLAAETVVGARIDVPLRQSPEDVSVSREDESITPNPAHHYGGKVVVLIDESAISQAEHTCLFIEAACHPEFIGTPTQGANGEVTNASLPGGIHFNFTGMSIRHGDGRQLQRIGILPTLAVVPTIAGLRAGRDEVLEAAVQRLARKR